MKRNLIMDVSFLFRSSFHANSKEQEDILLAMANKQFMDTINKNYRQHECDEVVLAFDGRKNWRKAYTRTGDCVTYKQYKGQRKDGLSDSELEKLKRFDEHVNEFREMLQTHTGLLVLHHERMEADDMIAGYVRMHKNQKHIVVSRDRDYLQLLRFPNVSIYDPQDGKFLDLKKYNDDPNYFMFYKCIRGDSGDNVIAAYPRVREPKIKAAYENDFDRNNMMQHAYSVEYIDRKTGDVKKKDLVVGEVFEENEMLMDLTKQPVPIREMIYESILDSFEQRGKYNMVKFLRFCSRMGFQHLISDINKYNKLLKGPRSLTV